MSHVIAATEALKAVLILMHGYGTCADDFMPIGNFIAQKMKSVEIHLVDGYQEAYGAKRRKWFSLESNNSADWKRDIQPAGSKMREYIKTILQSHPELTKKNIIVAGFSQGAMMALHVGLSESLGGVIAFSGVLVDDSVIQKNDGTTQILLVHGDKDNVLSATEMQNSCEKLFQSNIKHEMHIEPNLEHAINLNCLNKASTFISNIVQKL